MILYPNPKLNLGLHVVEKRQDGFHNIETLFYPVKGLADILEILPAKGDETTLTNTGLAVDSPIVDNLCYKAWLLLKTDFDISAVDIFLHKQIPFGAGLGGGSADAAQALVLLNDMFRLNLKKEELKQYAVKLGSDCAFFIENSPMFASGRGEVLEPIQVDLSGYFIGIVKPNVGVSTAQAYAGIKPCKPEKSLKEVIKLPVTEWKNCLKNDFEATVFRQYPVVEKVKADLYEYGAIYASMSGSGSSVFGIFSHQPKLSELFPDYFVHVGSA